MHGGVGEIIHDQKRFNKFVLQTLVHTYFVFYESESDGNI